MIPPWNMSGVIPPIRPGQPGHSADRSPYVAPLTAVVDRFALSPERITILKGLLAYRAALHGLGLTNGFQWLDGSFMEEVEVHESRPPKDIDVVTYFHIPAGESQISLASKAGNLFDQKHVKNTYKVDAYPAILGGPVSAREIKQTTYWYSMWSHRRDGLWKGFVQVDLSPGDDASAMAILTSKSTGMVTP